MRSTVVEHPEDMPRQCSDLLVSFFLALGKRCWKRVDLLDKAPKGESVSFKLHIQVHVVLL